MCLQRHFHLQYRLHISLTGYHIAYVFRGDLEAQNRVAYRKLVGRGLETDPEAAFIDFQAGAARVSHTIIRVARVIT